MIRNCCMLVAGLLLHTQIFAQDKTAASRTGEDYTLSNGAVEAVFSGSGSFDIEKLVLNGKQVVGAGKNETPWILIYKGPQGENPELKPEHAVYRGVQVRDDALAKTLVFTWELTLDYSPVKYPVRMYVTLPDGGELLQWNIEAYLYGAAADYDIDPHIDSWPLDGTALQNLLNNNSMMAEIERNPDYVSANLGYGLLGFHALEYMLFENAGPRALGKYTRPQLVYLVGVANDLCNMCVRLEASWAGLDNVTEEKQTILGDAELEPTFDYGASMRNSGKGGSKYRNYKDAAEEIIQGCIDIATEVGSQKIGRPANGTSSEDINYIESPYSQNSKTDFIDNIISIRNTYQGMTSGDASVSDWIEVVDPVLDTEVRNAISTAIEKIQACPAPFVDNRTAQAWKDAATYCNNDLVNALTKALTALSVEK